MKILLLTTYPIESYPFELNKCITRFHFFAYIIFNYLKKIKGVDLTLKQLHPFYNHINLTDLEFDSADHALLIEDNGFYKSYDLYKVLKKKIIGAKASINLYNKYVSNEDIYFYIFPVQTNFPNGFNLICPVDHILYNPNKSSDILSIIIGDDNKNSSSQKQNVLQQINNISDNTFERIIIKNMTDFKFKIKDSKFDFINLEYINCYYDLINEFTKSHIYIVTSPLQDEYLLYELSMCNVLIVSYKDFIPLNLIEFLDIFVYTTDLLPIDQIIKKIFTHNIRLKLIKSNLTWKDNVKKIYQQLSKFKHIQENINQDLNLDEQIKKNNENDQIIKTNNIDLSKFVYLQS